MVIEGKGLPSLPGHRDKSSQEPSVSQRRCTGGWLPALRVHPASRIEEQARADDGRSHNGFKTLKGCLCLAISAS